jgi:phosphate transport system substrate-binding protein
VKTNSTDLTNTRSCRVFSYVQSRLSRWLSGVRRTFTELHGITIPKLSFRAKSRKGSLAKLVLWTCIPLFFLSCSEPFKNDYRDNSPTSGKLKVYYDEGLYKHVINQAYTFESHYHNAHLELFMASENEAVQALYHDSCEAIVISRYLNDKEKKVFESKNYFPKYSVVALNGVALITNAKTPIHHLSYENLIALLTKPYEIKDSLGNTITLKVMFDRNNSSVLHYMIDSVLKGQKLSSSCNSLNSSLDCINYIAEHENSIGILDFAWLSDVDDSLSKVNKDKLHFVALSAPGKNVFEYPSQTSFKLGTYPLTRSVYVIRKTGEFSLAKGFESFVAGPKGQLTFLKQGLLPHRQAERTIEVKMEPIEVK